MAFSASTIGADRFAAMRALKLNSDGGADVGVVRADDHHAVAPRCQCMEPGDDLADRGIRVVVDLLIGHAQAVLVGNVHGVVVDQEIEQRVPLVSVGAGDRAEDADPAARRREQGQQPQRDHGFPGLPLCRGR